jgi:hypothetical protein
MYFDFDDRHPDLQRIDSAISWREGFLLSLVVHLVGILAIVMIPEVLPGLVAALTPDTSAVEQRMAAMREQEANQRRFVFVQPRAEFEAQRPPQNPELSDRDRKVMTPFQRPPEPATPAQEPCCRCRPAVLPALEAPECQADRSVPTCFPSSKVAGW